MLRYAYIACLVIPKPSFSEHSAENILSTTCSQKTHRVGPVCLSFYLPACFYSHLSSCFQFRTLERTVIKCCLLQNFNSGASVVPAPATLMGGHVVIVEGRVNSTSIGCQLLAVYIDFHEGEANSIIYR